MKAIRSIFATTAILALVSATASVAHDNDARENDDVLRPITVAAFGDWPYSQYLLDNAHLLTDSVNADRDVSLVVHVGDIHSGSMPCTSAGILPPVAKSNPGWNQRIFFEFQQFDEPVVYLPGDNEWADCHKSKQFASGAPLNELASLRELFYSRPGVTLGLHPRRVMSQALHAEESFPADSQFVENVMWTDSDVLFATFNIPGGSNDDTAPWSGVYSDPAAQSNEAAQRSAANLRWLARAFDAATSTRAKAVVIALQADMWDPEALAAGGSGLD